MSAKPNRALVLIDVQNEYETGNLKIEHPPIAGSLAAIGRAASGAITAGIPIVLVRQNAPATSPVFATGSEGWRFHPVVADLPAAKIVDKVLPSALAGTDLGEWLRAERIDTITIAGYMTQNCDESTIRQATHEGFAVEFLHDAAGAVSYRNALGHVSARQIHETALVVIESRFAAVLATDAWLDLVAKGEAAPRDGLYQSYRRAQEPVEA